MPTADDFKAKGNEAFAKKEFLKAAKLYRDAIALDSTNPVLYSNRAQCFINLADWTRAYRDSEAGLVSNPNDKIRGKLLFRRGLCAKELGHIDIAIKSFEEVISLDPTNQYAQEELQLLLDSGKSKKAKSSKTVQIPLEVVQNLPHPFDNIVHSKECVINSDVHQPMKSEVNLAIEELFGSQEMDETLPSSKMTAPVKFNEMPSMHLLKSLSNVPKEQKVGAYKLVTDLDDLTLKEMFFKTGVDSEFFDFYVESAIFAINSGNKPASRILSTLKLFQSLPRFSIVASMCPDFQKSGLLAAVEQNLPQHLTSFMSILS